MIKDSINTITWRYMPMGEAALLVEAISASSLANRYALALAQALDTLALPGLHAAVPALNSLLVRFDPLLLTHAQLELQLRDLLEQLAPMPATPERIITIPVIYGGEAGPDLQEAAERLGLAPGALIAEHCAHIYRVMMIGFAPGFPYIGLLPEPLVLPRRATPRSAVPAGSVAIAAGLTGIYPSRLPGGWHLIGRTPLQLFDPATSPPSTLAPGDGIRFEPQPAGLLP